MEALNCLAIGRRYDERGVVGVQIRKVRMKHREGRGRGVVEARTTIEFAWEGRELAKGLIMLHI